MTDPHTLNPPEPVTVPADAYCRNCGYIADTRVTFSETCDECHIPVEYHSVDQPDRARACTGRRWGCVVIAAGLAVFWGAVIGTIWRALS